jgi:hypothetical protein
MSENSNKSGEGMFAGFSEAVKESLTDENTMKLKMLVMEERKIKVLEDIAAELHTYNRNNRPWADRQRRLNLVEEDPNYLQAVLNQIRASKKVSGKKKITTKAKKK